MLISKKSKGAVNNINSVFFALRRQKRGGAANKATILVEYVLFFKGGIIAAIDDASNFAEG